MVICTARGTHAPASGHQNEALSKTPGSWNAGDAGGGARSGRRLMGRSRFGFESVELQDSKKPAGGTSKVTIHVDEMVGKEGMMQLLFLEGRG